jgi:hypothetical protein
MADTEMMPQVVLAAIYAAGERYDDETSQEYNTRVLKNGLSIMAMMNPRSYVGRALIDMANATGVFVGTVVDVKKVTYGDKVTKYEFSFKTSTPSKFSQGDVETYRTDSLDGVYGPLIEEMRRECKVGSKVRVWKKQENAKETSDGMKHSTILYMEKLS